MGEIFKNKMLNEELHVNVLPSGIKCYIIPKKGYVEKRAIIATKYGAMDLSFDFEGENVTTPEGVAHFLEHKIFEDEKLNLFEQFAKLGGDVNAYTNYNNTAYYFSCTDNFDENFELLLNFVFNPFLTDENIEKEKGIITQEINMYNDYPNWKGYFNAQSSMYKELPIKKDIAGTVESIQKIDKEILLKSFNAFYQPQNMIIVCSGDVDVDAIYRLIEKNIEIKPNKEVVRHSYKEPHEVEKKYIEEEMAVSIPMFNLAFKDNNLENDKAMLLVKSKMLIDIVTGESSAIYEKMYNDGIIDASFSFEYSSGLEYGMTLISGFSRDYKRVSEEIINEINRLVKEGIDKNRFEQIRRKHIGHYARNFNSIGTLINMQVDFVTKGEDIFTLMNAFEKVTIDMIEERLKQHLATENYVLSVVIPFK